MAIPRRIFTIWLNEDPQRPPLVEKCIASQQLLGYEHRVIGLDSPEWQQVQEESRYMRECAPTKLWVKCSDYLRMWLVYKYGGSFFDADMEFLPGKNLDDLLWNRAFISLELNGYWANSSFGFEAGHPLLKKYLDRVEKNARGDGDLIFEIGMRWWSDILWNEDMQGRHGVVACPAEMFYPYDHLKGVTNITPLTKVYHHYMKSWEPTEWKTV